MFVLIILLALMIGVFIAALVFATKTASDITDIKTDTLKSYKDSPDLRSAHSMLTWVAVVGWIAIALLIVAVIFGWEAIAGAGEEAASAEAEGEAGEAGEGGEKENAEKEEGVSSIFLRLCLFLVSAASIAIGVFGILAAQKIKRAQKDTANDIDPANKAWNKAYKSAIITASLGVGVIGLIVTMWIVKTAAKKSARQNAIKRREAAARRRQQAQIRQQQKRQQTFMDTLQLKQILSSPSRLASSPSRPASAGSIRPKANTGIPEPGLPEAENAPVSTVQRESIE